MFVLSKVVFALVRPGNLLLIILLTSTLLLWLPSLRARRSARALLTIAALAALAVGATPLPDLLLAPLENRFLPPAKLPERIEGIIVLGGALDEAVTDSRGQVALTNRAGRLPEAFFLARRHPEAHVLFTGGSGDFLIASTPEARAAGRFFAEMGLEPARLTLEDRSRTTYENALFAKRIAKPQAGQNWVLITSAWHMPRAVGCFRAQGWDVIPYPVDYRTTIVEAWIPQFDLTTAAVNLDTAAKEWLGLVAYRLMGRTSTLFPGPNPQ